MTVHGAFFEVTGTQSQLFTIVNAIERNDGRLSADSSATLDLWQEMLEEWFLVNARAILWADAMPGYEPISPEHADFKAYTEDAQRALDWARKSSALMGS